MYKIVFASSPQKNLNWGDNRMTYDSKLKSQFVDELFDVFMLLENKEEYYRFFEENL